ncbi:MAG TPA: hypothetical protein PLQ45_07210, partial [Anaerohalosphaeraceae bacterium]|nr:hypothetical protein [Anaerohalosphaeraceae bacterium]
NYPLAENVGAELYIQTLEKALRRVMQFSPVFLIVGLGFDVMKGDPTGSFALRAAWMRRVAEKIALLNLPVLVVQEGGYNLRNLKSGAAAFFTGFAETIDRRLKKMVVPLGTINPQDPKRNL